MKKQIILFLLFTFITSLLVASTSSDNLKIKKKGVILSYALTSVVNKKVEQPLTVMVTDSSDNPVESVPVIYQAISHPSDAKGYSLERKIAYTDKNGIANNHFILGSKKGIYECSARIKNNTSENDIVYFKLTARGSKWIFFLITGVIGGLALFLYGMSMMSGGMKKAAGNKMRSILSALTKNRVIGLAVGALVTMVIQSSSATTVMLVSFVQAGLMNFVQSLGVILGADIGTTITAQLIAFKFTDYALLMIGVGFIFKFFSKKESYKNFGEAILGFGILFFGMHIMSQSMHPLRSHKGFINLLLRLENPLLGILVGAIFTGLIQSSSAFTGIVIVLASQGLLSLEAGIPLILGSNIGTCITAGLASINTSRDAKRVAIAHVIFKVAGVLLLVFWIPTFANFIRSISPTADSSFSLLEARAAVVPRQIANSHTIFNVSIGLIFLPFTALFANVILKIFPKKKFETGTKPSIKHLDKTVINTPVLAVDLAKSEVLRMIKIVKRMLKAVIKPFFEQENLVDEIYPNISLLEGIEMRENKIDFLEEEVLKYLVKIQHRDLSNELANEVYVMMSSVNDLESIGDIIEKNIVPLIAKKEEAKKHFSPEGEDEILAYHIKVSKQLSRLETAFSELSTKDASKILKKDVKYEKLESEYRSSHLARVSSDIEESVSTHEIHMELLDLMKQINVYTLNIAKTIITSVDVEDEE